MKRQYNILHIIPHAGGGVGTVIRAILAAESVPEFPYKHTVASLEYLNEVTKAHFEKHHIPWIDEVAEKRQADLPALLQAADIVLAHWWNHPFIMKFLFQELPPIRLILWSHVNGYFPPQSFFPALFDMPDRFVFTSKTSFTAPVIQWLPDRIKAKLRVIRSCSGIPEGAENVCEKSNPFKAGYIGTVESVKMHSDFLSMCANANLPTPCIVAGGPAHEKLRQKAATTNLSSRFNILGPVKDPQAIYRQLHAFAYPMSPRHYGTGEQVLIEAMVYGAVPVVLSNPPEKALISHGETGIIAESAADFSAALRMLMENPAERSRLAAGGHHFVMEECGIEHSTRAFHTLFDETLDLPKQPRKLQPQPINGVTYGTPLHLFLTSLGNTEEKQLFERILYHERLDHIHDDFISKTRGTPFHYRSMLEDDPQLDALCNNVLTDGD
jgi:glycosyltransferase involved in cell wall biosynthesis